MPEWAWAIIGVVTPPLLSYIIGLFLPRRRTYGWGYRVGRIMTGLGQRRIGAGWERIEDRVKATYRDNYDRLVTIKDKYDPDNLFRVNQNIKPSH